MSNARIALLAAALLLAFPSIGAPSRAHAQAPDATDAPPAAEEEAEGGPAAVTAAPPPRAQPASPPPIMVVVLPARRVPEAIVAAASQALLAQVTPLAAGRPVHALGAPEVLEAIAACADDPCIGAQLAQAGAQAGVLLRLARDRRGLQATLELRDPVSGAPRREALSAPLPSDPEAAVAALGALTAQLADAMPSPPPPPASLLVTVNVDGAAVQVDGQDVGASPVAAVTVPEGPHDVDVRMPGYVGVRRRIEVRPGEQARLDVTLEVVGHVASSDAPVDPNNPWAQPDEGSGDLLGEWWFWTIIGAGAALLIGGAIGIGVAVSDQGPQMPVAPEGIPIPPITGGM